MIAFSVEWFTGLKRQTPKNVFGRGKGVFDDERVSVVWLFKILTYLITCSKIFN
jgi:hypothetical protein